MTHVQFEELRPARGDRKLASGLLGRISVFSCPEGAAARPLSLPNALCSAEAERCGQGRQGSADSKAAFNHHNGKKNKA